MIIGPENNHLSLGLIEIFQCSASIEKSTINQQIHYQLLQRYLNFFMKSCVVHYYHANYNEHHNFQESLAIHAETYVGMLQQYDVVARIIMPAIQQRIDNTQTALKQAMKHYQLDLESVMLSQGDFHCLHAGTCLLIDKQQKQYFFKQRGTDMDDLFADLCHLLSIQSGCPTLHACGNTHIAEAIPYQASDDLKTFYYNFGEKLAVLYLLGATDIHYENIICHGIASIIDLETLTHATHRYGDWCHAYDIFHTMCLPQISYPAKDFPGIDLSALGFLGNTAWPQKVLTLIDKQTRHPAFKKIEKIIPEAKNLPASKTNKIYEHSQDLIHGFQQACHKIIVHKKALLALITARERHYRLLLRPTDTYNQLIRHSDHPELLKNVDTYKQYFMQIIKSRYGKGLPDTVIDYEVESLMQHDVPFFTAAIDGTDLHVGEKQSIKGFFQTTALSGIQQRLVKVINNQSIKRLSCLIESSIKVSYMNKQRQGYYADTH